MMPLLDVICVLDKLILAFLGFNAILLVENQNKIQVYKVKFHASPHSLRLTI